MVKVVAHYTFASGIIGINSDRVVGAFIRLEVNGLKAVLFIPQVLAQAGIFKELFKNNSIFLPMAKFK
jgi:hypothetical protein